MNVLILGGTTEASVIARALVGDARYAPIVSFAGRTRAPLAPPVPYRVGGFGGAGGLAAYIAAERIEALIDATHPFAAQMKTNAATVAIPRVAVARPEWQQVHGDRWQTVATMADAYRAIGLAPRRVFLSVGQQELAAFGPPHRYLIRSVDPLVDLPPDAEAFTARGPFDLPAERKLLLMRNIEVLVAKNSGGTATAPKLQAARELGIDVIMIARPPPPPGPTVADAEGALSWLHHQAKLRGV